MDKVCRLCGGRDQPQHNIFGFNKDFVRKIQLLLRITISEWDDLPHKICFRCSAKVTDLHEFQQKCVETQSKLRSMVGKKEGIGRDTKKTTARTLWEEELKKKKLSNDEYCDLLIRQTLASVPNMLDNLNDFEEELSLSETPMIPEDLKFDGLKLVLHRVDSESFKGIKKNRNGTYTILKDIPAEQEKIPDYMTPITVGGVGQIFSCNHCNSIVMSVDKLKTHKCQKLKTKETKKPSEPEAKTPQIVQESQNLTVNFPPNCLLVPVGNGAFAIKVSDGKEAINIDNPIIQKEPSAKEPSAPPKLPTLAPIEPINKVKRSRKRKVVEPKELLVQEHPVENLGKRPRKSNNSLQNFSMDYFPDKTVPKKQPTSKPQAFSSKSFSMDYFPNDPTPKKQQTSTLQTLSSKSFSNDYFPSDDDEPLMGSNKVADVEKILPTNNTPYPIGLICRNTPGPLSKKRPKVKEPEYEILPPSNPGRIVIKSTQLPSDNKKKVNDSSKHYFTYINLETQPHSVFPTKQSLQESQISTTESPLKHKAKKAHNSLKEKKYSCEVCSMSFSKQKKLVAHIETHFDD